MMFVPLEDEEMGKQREVRWISLDGRVQRKCLEVTFFWPISMALFGEKPLMCVICLFATQRLLMLVSSAPILIFGGSFSLYRHVCLFLHT